MTSYVHSYSMTGLVSLYTAKLLVVLSSVWSSEILSDL